MERSKLVTTHVTATIIAVLTISSFFSFSLIAEIIGDELFIQQVKTVVLYCLPILVIAMPVLGLSGSKLAGNSNSPIVAKKLARMKLIVLNGLILICLAVYLYYHVTYKTIDRTFLLAQIAELLIGAINMSLIAKNIWAGLKLTVKQKANRLFQ